MAWVWMDGIVLAFLDIFAFSVWVVYLSELVKYLLIERYLAAKIGTILGGFGLVGLLHCV